MFGRTELTLYPGMKGMTENGFINTKAVSYTIDADLDIPDGGAEGVVLSQAGQTGGWSLYVKDGKPKYAYNWLAREMYTVEGDQPLPAGSVTLAFDFAYDGGGLHKGATGTIAINGETGRQRPHRQDHGRRLLTCRRNRRRRHRRLLTRHRRLRPMGQRLHRHHQQDHHPTQRPSSRGHSSPHASLPKLGEGHGWAANSSSQAGGRPSTVSYDRGLRRLANGQAGRRARHS